MAPQSIRILIVDDMKSSRSLLRKQLSEQGFESVREAEDADAALALLREQHDAKAPFEVVFCDWNMPGKSGLVLLQELRALPDFRAVPVIMFTSEGAFAQIKEAVASGATNYLTKPYTVETLFEKLDFVVEKYRLGRK